MNARLVRLTSLLAGYVALLLLDRSWQLLEERAAAVTDVAEATLGALAAVDEAALATLAEVDELVAFDVSDVIAAHNCACCRSGAASWPPAAAQGAAEGAA